MEICNKCNSEAERPLTSIFDKWNPLLDTWNPTWLSNCKCIDPNNQPERLSEKTRKEMWDAIV